MSTTPIDWEARARDAGAIGYTPATKTASKGKIDWTAAAKEFGATGSTPAASPVSGGLTEGHNLPPPEEGFWHSLGSQVKAILNPDILFSASPVPNPQTAVEMAGNFTTAIQQAKEPISPKTGLPFPDPTGALRAGHTAAALLTPIGGNIIEKGLEQLESGNVRGAAGTAVGAALPFAAGRLMHPKAPMPAAEVLPKHVEALTGLIEDRAGTVDPHATATEALPSLRETAVRMKLDPTAMSGREAGQATLKIAEQAVRDVQNEFKEIAKPYNPVLVDQSSIAAAYREAITPELLANEPRVAAALERQAKKFDQPAPLERVNQFRVRMNNQLNAFEQRGTTAQIMSDIESKANKAAANAARDVEYNTVGRLSGLDPEYVRALKQREGALIEAKTSLTKEYNRASGEQGEAVSKTLREKATSTFPSKHGAEKSILKNVLGPKPIDVLNSRINRMFEGMGEARALPEYQQIQPPEAPQMSGPSGPVPADTGPAPKAAIEERGIKVPQKRTFLRTTQADVKDYYNYRFDQLRSELKSAETPEARADVERRMSELSQTQQTHPVSVDEAQFENAFYTQARADLGAAASPEAVQARAHALKVEHAAKSAPPPVTPANPPKPQTLTQKMANRPLPKLRRVEAPRTGTGAAYQPSPAVQASLIMLQAKQGLITPAEADSRIQRLVGSGGRRTIRRPVGPE